MTKLVHWQEDDFDIRIMRPSKWGNPFIVGKHGTREQCIEKYALWFLTQTDLIDQISELRGKTLGCCCVGIKGRCHGEILAKTADEDITWLRQWQNSKSGYQGLIEMLDGSKIMSAVAKHT